MTKKITILELAPCADTIYQMRPDGEEGYIASDGETLSIRCGAKLRPRTVSVYAGGKSTNVARIMDRLLGAEDPVTVELVVFRPNNPEGRFIHDLQASALSRVRLRPIIAHGSARLCIDLSDPDTLLDRHVEFNISPRVVWEPRTLEAVEQFADQLDSDLVVAAGNPPVLVDGGSPVADLYARIIGRAGPNVRAWSFDVEKTVLTEVIAATPQPAVIKINEKEYSSVESRIWETFRGTLLVTDSTGCRLWEDRERDEMKRVHGARLEKIYSTIGAGDAVHAGFTVARWVWGWESIEAAQYGLAAGAAAVSSPEGTRDVTKADVDRIFDDMRLIS